MNTDCTDIKKENISGHGLTQITRILLKTNEFVFKI